MRRMMMVAVMAAFFAVLSAYFSGQVFAGDQLQLITSEQLSVGAPGGSFTFSGDFVDFGTFVFESFLTAGPPSFGVSTEYLVQRYSGQAGTLEVQSECLSVFDGVDSFIDTCQAVVKGGTGAYDGLRGSGNCSGVINLTTRLATRLCHLRVHL